MKTQTYIVTITMPDGDYIGDKIIEDEIQGFCDVDDTGRQKVKVIDTTRWDSTGELITKAGNLVEAIERYVEPKKGEHCTRNELLIVKNQLKDLLK